MSDTVAVKDLRKVAARLPLRQFLDYQDLHEGWRRYQVPWPEVKGPKFGLEHYDIPRDGEHRLRTIKNEGPNRDPGWGPFTRLVEYDPVPSADPLQRINAEKPGRVWMSDTRAEILEHQQMLTRLEEVRPGARVLINGLGLGVVVRAALLNPDVARVDVVEINADVVRLVAPLFHDRRLVIRIADAYETEWADSSRWDLAWHDIWPTIGTENLPGMHQLQQKYRERVGWQGFWQISGCRKMADVLVRMDNQTLPVAEAMEYAQGRMHL